MIRFHDRYRSARFWAISLLFWFIVLNLLSHGDRFHPPRAFAFDIPHFDKVVHFGYFFGGGGLFAASLFFKKLKPSWGRIILTVTVVLSVIGIWDEFHQSFFANRTGNDPGDWSADTLGALSGALVFKKVHRVLLPPAREES
ncbi:VanZ family protein [Akkermansiaceae bacterium]|nr:VanZ family protein [Akkermansiaceae bacterium]MDB4644138.1 VanZ family protein [bacterium]